MLKEDLFSINEYNKPKISKGRDAICLLLLRILTLTPGDSQRYPEMGVGLVTQWRYVDSEKLPELKNVIEKQISEYLPSFQTLDISLGININTKELLVDVNIDNTLYSFTTNNDRDTVLLKDI